MSRDGKQETEPSMEIKCIETQEKSTINNEISNKMRNQSTRQNNRKGKLSYLEVSHFILDGEQKMGKNGQLIITESDIPAKEIKLAKILMDKPAPHCSAQSWSIFDQKTNTMMFGKNEREKREVASITKMMTCYVVLTLQERFKKKDECLVEITEDASSIHGTSADLLAGDTLTIWQLLFGLMLPSGNDAAFTLAEYFGNLLKKAAHEEEQKI